MEKLKSIKAAEVCDASKAEKGYAAWYKTLPLLLPECFKDLTGLLNEYYIEKGFKDL